MENSKISWCHHTGNLWWGCVNVNMLCFLCFAEYFAKNRHKHNIWGNDVPRKEIITVWKAFVKFQRDAFEANEIRRVFVGSMMDIFEKPMSLINWKNEPLLNENGEQINTGQLRDRFFNEVVPNSPNLLFLLLTKRPSNINKYIPESWKTNPPRNVMFGTSVGYQENAENFILHLSKVRGNKFLSIEPQLSEIDLMVKLQDGSGRSLIDVPNWIINGGESGLGRRPFDTDWARKLRDDCKNKVPFFFKQIDQVLPIPKDLMIREFPIIA